jgi:hypothetical protein
VSEQQQEYNPTWEGIQKDAAPGTKIAGVLVNARVATFRNGQRAGEDFPILEIRKDDGTLVDVPAWHTALGGKNGEGGVLNTVKPQLNEPITIEYLGEVTSGSGNAYRSYAVNGVTGGGARKPAWLQNAESAEAPIPQAAPQPVAAAVAAQDASDDDDIPF